MKLLLIFVLGAANWLLAIQAPPAPDKYEQRPETGAGARREQQEKPPPIAALTLQSNKSAQAGEQDKQSHTNDTPKHPHDLVDRVNAFSTLVIAAFTVLLFFAVKWQTETSRNTERAWIIVRPIEQAPDLQVVRAGADLRNIFAVSIRNSGRTPAYLIESSIKYELLQGKNLEEALLKEKRPYGQPESHADLILVPKDSIRAFAFLEPNSLLTQQQAHAVHNAEAFLYAYGFVSYRDAYRRKHITRFGYVYLMPQGGTPQILLGFRRAGPSEYNHAT